MRADGGYVIWWPAAGFEFKDYPPSGLPDWPLWLLPSLEAGPAADALSATDVRDRVATQIEGIIKTVAGAREGERNALTHWGACRIGEMVAIGEIAASFGTELIAEAAARAGLPRTEALPTIRSGMRKGGAS